MMAYNAQLFAIALFHWRSERGLRETAELTGVSASTLSRLERGEKPDIETFALLCERMGADPAVFFKPSDFTERLIALDDDKKKHDAEYEQRKADLWREAIGQSMQPTKPED
jgi:transcriptional regulator with XRE-family HTH domain